MSLNKLDLYISLLKVYNEKVNVYSKTAYDRLPFHIEDSIHIADLISNQNHTVMDMGSGSGLPSIPIAIHNPNNLVFAIETRHKKCDFLRHIKKELDLKNFEVIQNNVLDFSYKNKQTPQFVTAKAFAPTPKAIALAKKLGGPGAQLIVPISNNQKASLLRDKIVQSHIHSIPKKPFHYFIYQI